MIVNTVVDKKNSIMIHTVTGNMTYEGIKSLVGHTTTEWCKNGLSVSVNPPVVSQNKQINISDISNTIVYLISLGFAPGTIKSDFKAEDMSLMVTFTKTGDNELMGKRIL